MNYDVTVMLISTAGGIKVLFGIIESSWCGNIELVIVALEKLHQIEMREQRVMYDEVRKQ